MCHCSKAEKAREGTQGGQHTEEPEGCHRVVEKGETHVLYNTFPFCLKPVCNESGNLPLSLLDHTGAVCPGGRDLMADIV